MARIYVIIRLFALAFVSFMAGGILVVLQLPPYQLLLDSLKGAQALREIVVTRLNLALEDDWLPPEQWAIARSNRTGAIIHNKKKAFPGYTIFSSLGDKDARLIDMNGKVLHRWSLAYRQIWQPGSRIRNPVPEKGIAWDKVMLQPNGDIFVNYVGNGDTPYGYGLARLDRKSRLLWKYLDHAHHDIAIGAKGRIYTLVSKIRYHGVPGRKALATPYPR